MKNLKSRKMQVYKILRDYKRTRDDDLKLYEKYLVFNSLLNPYWNALITFLRDIKKGNIMSFESVSRFRRMLQKEYPSLRGKMYGKRKKMIKQTQRDLGYNVK